MGESLERASVRAAQAIFDDLGPIEKAAVLKEAREKGIDPVELVRQSLDILITDSEDAFAPRPARKPPN